MPATLLDRYGRIADKLRISVTDRCNFRCTYCMPAEGIQWMSKQDILTLEEIARLASVFVQLGVKHIRLTGGEPLLRRDLAVLIRQLKGLPGLNKLAITTNGFYLAEQAQALYEAGLHSFNVSLDSLDPRRFEQMTRRDWFKQVQQGLHILGQWPNCEIKINAVVIRGFNDDEAVGFADLARKYGYAVRFIEFMPLGADDHWTDQRVIPGQELLQRIQAVYPVEQIMTAGRSPASRWRFVDSPGEIGFINSVSEPFCHNCNRIRLTADGQLRTCLFSLQETNLKEPLRAGATDEELMQMIVNAVQNKEEGHLINKTSFVRPERTMAQIGG